MNPGGENERVQNPARRRGLGRNAGGFRNLFVFVAGIPLNNNIILI